MLSSLTLAALCGTALLFCARTLRLARTHKVWTRRRLVIARDAGVLLGLQVANTTFWVAPYALVVAQTCAWFNPPIKWFSFARWTLYNASWNWCAAARWCSRTAAGFHSYALRLSVHGAPVCAVR